MAVTRQVVVDDTSPLIRYEGPEWFPDITGAHDAKGNFGPVYNKTLHGTIKTTSFSFAYTGSGIHVLGSNNVRNDSVGVLDPQWECFLDGIPLPSTPFDYFENSWSFCSTSSTPMENDYAPHVLTVNVTVRRAQAFYLDRLIYKPSPGTSFVDETIIVENTDPELQLGPGWRDWGGLSNITGQTGSNFRFYFHGTSLSWYGLIPSEIPRTPATGTYSVDDEAPRSFALKGLPEGKDATEYNQEFFRTPEYPRGRHKLEVVFLGNEQTTSLVLDYLIIRNKTVSVAPSAGSPSSTQGPGDNANPNLSGSHSRLGAIIGGVLGGLAALLLLILVVFYVKRQRQIPKIHHYQPHSVTISPTTHAGPGSPIQPPYPVSPSSPNSEVTIDNAPQFLPSSKIIRRERQNDIPESISPSPTSPDYAPSPYNSNPSAISPVISPQPPINGHTTVPNVIMHEDSGIRNVIVPQQVNIEIPPTYSPT